MFTPYKINNQIIVNRIVRSATADSEIYASNRVTSETLNRYRSLAESGIGLIITGDFPTVNSEMLSMFASGNFDYNYDFIKVEGAGAIAEAVHSANRNAKIFAQLSPANISCIPSDYPSPWGTENMHVLTEDEIHFITDCFVKTAIEIHKEGFDGIQLHAAHGGFLSLFLSPYSNHRSDSYGGTHENRCRIIADIVNPIKEQLPSFSVIIKINGTDYLPDGINLDNFPEFSDAVASTGIDAVEISGGMWEAIALSEDELGFPPVPALESRTSINTASKQSYFRSYSKIFKERHPHIPLILTGGNRSADIIEDILETGAADFIGLCRPFICEPDLMSLWQKNLNYNPKCINCNACIYDLWNHPGSEEFRETYCLYKKQLADPEFKDIYKKAINWIKNWKTENL